MGTTGSPAPQPPPTPRQPPTQQQPLPQQHQPPPAGQQPPVPQRPPGSVPVTGAELPTALYLTVTRRLLWVDGAAYPLQNVARVYTFILQPRRKEAVLTFVKRTAVTLLTAMAFTLFGGMATVLAREADSFDGLLQFVWFISVAGLIYFLADMLAVLTASSHFVLAVESNGQSTALVTGEREHLNQIVHQIAYAIENPDTELRVRVERLTISNPRNYYFGDAVNMYGGSGNVGMAGA